MVPQHIAIIPDGNRRWARSRGLNPSEGHRRGVRAFELVADAAWGMGVPHLSIWGASRDNILKRSVAEVRILFALFTEHLEKLLTGKKIHERRVRVRVLGEWPRLFPRPFREIAKKLETETRPYRASNLTFLMGYDGRREMEEAFRKAKAEHEHATANLEHYLWTRELPPVDLVVRTGGEPHWSAGFLMWQTANSEFYFTKKLWPAFTPADLRKAVAVYETRRRMMGK